MTAALVVDVGTSGPTGLTMSLDGDDANEDLGDETETTNRSERKRQREKQRRSDLSSAFDELSAFIVQVEPDSADADSDTKKKRKKSGDGEDSSGITRLDLIGRALRIMKRLHRENEQNKRIIASIREREMGGQSNDNVLVMLPTLTPAADELYPVARATYPSYPPHHPPYYQSSHIASHLGQPPHLSQPPPGGPEFTSAGMPPQGRQQHHYPSDWSRYGRPQHPPTHYMGQAPDQRGNSSGHGAEGPGRGEPERR